MFPAALPGPVVFSIQKSTPVSSTVAGKSPLNRGIFMGKLSEMGDFYGKVLEIEVFLWENDLEMGDFYGKMI